MLKIRKFKIKGILLISLLVFGCLAKAQISLIPQPSSVVISKGNYEITKNSILNFDTSNDGLKRIAQSLNDYLKRYHGIALKTAQGKTGSIRLGLDAKAAYGKEGYRLQVDNKGISITGSTPNGIFYAVQTLKQLLPVGERLPASLGAVNRVCTVPFAEITDKPRFSWRGMHLDVGRHYFPIPAIKKFIDQMAMYKYNTFHWHLTEDQGWRIDIKKYPKLAETGSWRDETTIGFNDKGFDGIGYGGFYTHSQIKEIVKYAAERYITVVPEIEMPGHSNAALASYPELGCTGGPYEVPKTWGVFNDVFCAGKEQTFTFLEGVLDEVCELFPSAYIHVGGDECPKEKWINCPHCQQRIKDEGLKNEHELQSYFMHRIEKYLAKKKKKMIGWEEIMEGGVSPDVTVMAWRKATNGAFTIAKQHHEEVVCTSSWCYFNYYQIEDKDKEPFAHGAQILPLEKVYNFEPVPKGLTSEEAKYIIGTQGNLWTEFITNTGNLEYMMFPRICAMAEVTWTDAAKKDFDGFKTRMETEFQRLKMYGNNYCDHPYELKSVKK